MNVSNTGTFPYGTLWDLNFIAITVREVKRKDIVSRIEKNQIRSDQLISEQMGSNGIKWNGRDWGVCSKEDLHTYIFWLEVVVALSSVIMFEGLSCMLTDCLVCKRIIRSQFSFDLKFDAIIWRQCLVSKFIPHHSQQMNWNIRWSLTVCCSFYGPDSKHRYMLCLCYLA